MNLSKSQLDAFAITFTLARHEWRLATGRRSKDISYVHPIPLTKHYKMYSGRCRDMVLAAFDIFFTRVNRGSNLTKKASGWEPRPKGTVLRLISSSGNSYEDTMTNLKKLYEDNKDKIHTVRQHIFTKDEIDTVSTVIQTELVWESDVLRQVFEEVAVASLSGPTFESKEKFKVKQDDLKKALCDVLKMVSLMTDEEKDPSHPIWNDPEVCRQWIKSKV